MCSSACKMKKIKEKPPKKRKTEEKIKKNKKKIYNQKYVGKSMERKGGYPYL